MPCLQRVIVPTKAVLTGRLEPRETIPAMWAADCSSFSLPAVSEYGHITEFILDTEH